MKVLRQHKGLTSPQTAKIAQGPYITKGAEVVAQRRDVSMGGVERVAVGTKRSSSRGLPSPGSRRAQSSLSLNNSSQASSYSSISHVQHDTHTEEGESQVGSGVQPTKAARRKHRQAVSRHAVHTRPKINYLAIIHRLLELYVGPPSLRTDPLSLRSPPNPPRPLSHHKLCPPPDLQPLLPQTGMMLEVVRTRRKAVNFTSLL